MGDSLSRRAEPVALLGPVLKPVIRSEGRAFDRPTPVAGDEDRPGDRLFAGLPGVPPSRPQPGWAALSGLALAAALLLCVLMAGRGRQPLGGT